MRGSFSAQSADLHSIWASYKGRQAFRILGTLHVSQEGYIFWTGQWKIALCQFRDNILMASDVELGDCKELVSLVLETVWDLPVECACANTDGNYHGNCLGPVIRCMGFCIALRHRAGGINHVHPAALKDDWSLRLGPPLMTPKHAYKGYLSRIFTGALANGRPWLQSWVGQILSTIAWMQIAMLLGHSRADSARAMHRALHYAFAVEPPFLLATVKAVYTASYSIPNLPSLKCVAIANLQVWLRRWAHWEGDRYTS